jgi:hypothetical protein
VSTTPELLQNPVVFSSNSQLLSAAVEELIEEVIEEDVLLELLATLLIGLEYELVVGALELAGCVLDEDAVAPHTVPVTCAVPAVPFAWKPKVVDALGPSVEFQPAAVAV